MKFPWIPRSMAAPRWRNGTSVSALAIAAALAATVGIGRPDDRRASAQPAAAERSSDDQATGSSPATVELDQQQWKAAGVRIEPARRRSFARSVRLTGKVGLNEDRVAHIFPMVEGVVDSVHVQLGQRVEAHAPLLVIQSREVGQAKLELYQARLMHETAKVRHQRTQEVGKNTRELIEALRKDATIESIEHRFRNRPMGDYRQQLLAAYAGFYKSQADVDRLASLGDSGAVAAKRFISAEARRNADRATFQAALEQIAYDIENSLLLSSQELKESATRVAVAETNLEILGYEKDELASINPAQEGEAIAHYPIRAPFDGTVLSKDAALLEHTRPDVQLLTIADLSSVWVKADVYEEHLPLIQSLTGKTVIVRNEAWPDRTFEAQIFYTGDVMDEATRTISMRAVADNADRLLKPGMFVTVELPETESKDVVQVPLDAVQEHEGETFVFIHKGGDRFERRNVRTGRAARGTVELLEGVEANEPVAISGGFILKSRMLADLMSGD